MKTKEDFEEYRLILKSALDKQPDNHFVQGCAVFFIKAGFLTDAQVEALKNTKSQKAWEDDYCENCGEYY